MAVPGIADVASRGPPVRGPALVGSLGGRPGPACLRPAVREPGRPDLHPGAAAQPGLPGTLPLRHQAQVDAGTGTGRHRVLQPGCPSAEPRADADPGLPRQRGSERCPCRQPDHGERPHVAGARHHARRVGLSGVVEVRLGDGLGAEQPPDRDQGRRWGRSSRGCCGRPPRGRNQRGRTRVRAAAGPAGGRPGRPRRVRLAAALDRPGSQGEFRVDGPGGGPTRPDGRDRG